MHHGHLQGLSGQVYNSSLVAKLQDSGLQKRLENCGLVIVVRHESLQGLDMALVYEIFRNLTLSSRASLEMTLSSRAFRNLTPGHTNSSIQGFLTLFRDFLISILFLHLKPN
jgi:hypothetical protein